MGCFHDDKYISIYKIECIPTGRVYIGQTMNFEGRIKRHLWSLKSGKHKVPLMQSDFDKYGESAFTACVLKKASPWGIVCGDEVMRSECSVCEKAAMEKYKSYLPEYGYNYRDPYFYPHGGKRKTIEKEPNDFMEVS